MTSQKIARHIRRKIRHSYKNREVGGPRPRGADLNRRPITDGGKRDGSQRAPKLKEGKIEAISCPVGGGFYAGEKRAEAFAAIRAAAGIRHAAFERIGGRIEGVVARASEEGHRRRFGRNGGACHTRRNDRAIYETLESTNGYITDVAVLFRHFLA